MKIEVPDNILEIAKLIATQDNRATDHPLFIVQEEVREPTYDGCADEYFYYDQHNCRELDDDEKTTVDSLFSFFKLNIESFVDTDIPTNREINEWLESVGKSGFFDIVRMEDLTKNYYKKEWVYVTACFTEKGCNEYINANKHRHAGKLRVFADQSFRNFEFQAIRNFLLQINAESK